MVWYDPESLGRRKASSFEHLLRRDRAITLTGLAALCALAWLYVATGAGLGMSAAQMTSLALFPHKHADLMSSVPESAWGFSTWVLVISMWWVMMIAMMTPSAAPTILLYAQVHRRALAQVQVQDRLAPTWAFAAAYLCTWLGFSVVAAALHWALQRAELVYPMMMGSQSRWLSGLVLMAAGLYQFSPLKTMCLTHCRAPAAFLARHWRPHVPGALRLGAMHAAYCVACCWILMALLFVGGVMNLVWIAALTLLVLVEKCLPGGRGIGRATGIVLVVWGIATFLV